jgi:2,3-bisphosphoglycerate-independent phosphoglycerate mutase
MRSRKAVLCILDGWGHGPSDAGNAIARARTPTFDSLSARFPNTLLAASGLAVGLPEGQPGNSEVGHLTIGSGRIVLEDLTRINAAIADGSFFENAVLADAVELALGRGSRLHLLGLLSPGGVHSHQEHLVALCELARRHGLSKVFIHAFTDGRDEPQTSGAGYVRWLEGRLAEIGVGQLATIGGRYFAMDRDGRWDRLEAGYRALLGRCEHHVRFAAEYLDQCYADGTTDEFIPPAGIVREGQEAIGIGSGDVAIHFNFRPDRARELCHALIDPNFTGFDRGVPLSDLSLSTFTNYDDSLPVEVAFRKAMVENTLGQVVSDAGLSQFHVAETEKYAHVTYFINGGREQELPAESRLLVPSSKVATYDQEPRMAANEITAAVEEQLRLGNHSLVVVNYANADMVGHTGDLAATVSAVEFLDRCLGRLLEAADKAKYIFLLTSDHGNAEEMVDPSTGAVVTSHTANLVPMVLTDERASGLSDGGGLRDVAPTLLAAMGLPAPTEMTGSDLRVEA